VACRTQQAFGARARVATGIANDPCFDGEEVALGIRTNFQLDRHRMPLHVMLGRLLACQRCLDRTAEQIRGDCGLSLN